MKTTIDISDPLFEAARKAARERGTTLRALVEMALRHILEQPERAQRKFKLRDVSFAGKGLQPGTRELGWEALRELSYGDRGR